MRRLEAAALLMAFCSCTPIVQCVIDQHANAGGAPEDSGSGTTVDAGAVDSGVMDSGTKDAGPTDAGTPDSGTIFDSGFCPYDSTHYVVIDFSSIPAPDSGAISDVGMVAFHGGVPPFAGSSAFALEIVDAGELLTVVADHGGVAVLDHPTVATPLFSLSLTSDHPSPAQGSDCTEVLVTDANSVSHLLAVDPYCYDTTNFTLGGLPPGLSGLLGIGWSDAGSRGTLAIVSFGQTYLRDEVVVLDGGDSGWTVGPPPVESFFTSPIIESINLATGLKWIVADQFTDLTYGARVYDAGFDPYLSAPLRSVRELRPVPYSSSKWVVGTFDGGSLDVMFWDGTLSESNYNPVADAGAVLSGVPDPDSLQAALIAIGSVNYVRFAWTQSGHVYYADLNPLTKALTVNPLCALEPIVYVAPLDDIHMLIKGQSGTVWVRTVP